MMLELVDYDIKFLNFSWHWLHDPEIKRLTNTNDFTREDQLNFFKSLNLKTDYFIYGIKINGVEAGACGFKNVKNGSAEYWGYIGEKIFWNLGFGKEMLKQVQKKAVAQGIIELYLKVANENSKAMRFYLSAGFKIINKKSDLVIMKKNIRNFTC